MSRRKKKPKVLFYLAINPFHLSNGLSPQVLIIYNNKQVAVIHKLEEAYEAARNKAVEHERRMHTDGNVIIGKG